MKNFCDSLMKLNSSMPYGNDFSPILLALFIRENGYSANQRYQVYDYVLFLYRFYSDESQIRKLHYNKIINEISHYKPSDIVPYTKTILEYISLRTGLLAVGNSEFVLLNCPNEIEKYKTLIDNVINTLVTKYIGKAYCQYKSAICEDEFKSKESFSSNTRVFNRALENINYCFICDEFHKNNLTAVQLTNLGEFDSDNYLILCKEHASMFLNKELIIKKNGYPYIDGKRNYHHLEIGVLKKVRKNLQDI